MIIFLLSRSHQAAQGDNQMEHLDIRETPKLRDPALLMAFAGWNDASSAATTAASFITEKMGGSEFAQIDSDPFYNFQDMRPHVSLDENSRRKITWPSNTFYACETPNLEHDVVVFLGVEPHLQWGRFSKIILSMVRDCRVRMAVTVGALLADVYHRNRVRITGTSTNPDLASQLGLKPSRYEGPTGIVGVLNNLFRDENLPAVSVWANVPHYVNVTPNPKAALALVERLSEFLSYPLNLSELEAGAHEFEEKVDEALEKNKSVKDYVEQLKLRDDGFDEETQPGELPSGDELARELERFLRNRGADGDAPEEN